MKDQDIIDFWFREIPPDRWWAKDSAFDRALAERFGATHRAAARCELHEWRGSPQGRLAEVIVLDQFSRNIHRGDPLSFACDPLALGLAQDAIRAGADAAIPPEQRTFLYMPFTHSESAAIHKVAVKLFGAPGMGNLDHELKHKAIIDRFGRYPHRNAILGRRSTPEELEFLQGPGSSF